MRRARPTGELPVVDLGAFQARLAAVFAAPFPVLLTPRLRLRALRDDDAEALHAVYADPEDARYLGAAARDVAETLERVRRNRDLFPAGEGVRWALTLRAGPNAPNAASDPSEDDVALGTCGHWRLLKAHMRSEIGYELRREFRGQGLMQEALRAVLAFGFQAMGLHSIEAQADARNHGSRRVLERAGFVLEGYLPENYVVGALVTDGALYGLRARELVLDPAGAYEREVSAASAELPAADLSARPTLPPLGPA